MRGVPIQKIFLFFSQLLYHLAHSLIASHINSHSNTNTGLIANNNISNAIRGLMNNIIINNNNNNIIICFSLYLIEQQGIEPYTTLVHHVLYSSSMDYTPLSLGLDLHQYSLAQGATYHYYLHQVLLYASYVKGSLTYNKIKEKEI